mmetsp:Transcript_11007/g.18243  ORF Transcript_11007/g.18243 Transcript_11007/m.18243 type:complete len:119 (-) Transcript_11007:434-790(-)|eukprot:CAMPEP_0119027828 /NCGR_PEP_ID=MMETSP1176-20130426/37830_1 /TAXON_ID=265551 /ORGANISM="Synedropsis recta cf, Strain CCMP1620" /LENGTH=118 /DNA_ID=CAMNT_0006983833 /DNA_START=430 /DNA_END=786 /DNA_ORIENTATION=-
MTRVAASGAYSDCNETYTNSDIIELKKKCEEKEEAENIQIGLKDFVALLSHTKVMGWISINKSFAATAGEEMGGASAIDYLDLIVKSFESKQRNESEQMTQAFSLVWDVEKDGASAKR